MFDEYINPYSKRVRFVGGLSIVAGFIGGIVAGNVTHDFSWLVALYFWINSIVGAIFIYGFAEIIEILYRIYKKIDSLEDISEAVKSMKKYS